MKRVIVLSFLAALGAAPVLALNPTPASAFPVIVIIRIMP